MPSTSFHETARSIQAVLDDAVAAAQATLVRIEIDPRSSVRGYLAGLIRFSNGSELHFREFVDTGQPEPRLMYAYHYQDERERLIFRYDNALHRPPLSQPEHRHSPAGVQAWAAPTLSQVLDEILSGIP